MIPSCGWIVQFDQQHREVHRARVPLPRVAREVVDERILGAEDVAEVREEGALPYLQTMGFYAL